MKFLFKYTAIFVLFFGLSTSVFAQGIPPSNTPTSTPTLTPSATPTGVAPPTSGGTLNALEYKERLKSDTAMQSILSVHESRLKFPIKPCRSGCNLLDESTITDEKRGCGETFAPNFLDTPSNYFDGTNSVAGGSKEVAKTKEGFSKDKTVRPMANSISDWLKFPQKSLWIDDPEVTSLGKGGERARQFLLWTLGSQSIDSSPTILEVWKISRNISLLLIVGVVVLMGIGIIIGQRNNFSIGVDVWPKVTRVAGYLIFVIFSAAIVLFFIQIADIIMEFFVRSLGVRDLFNIFFVDPNATSVTKGANVVLSGSEVAYRTFLGCSDLSTDMIESVRTSKYLVNFTNMTYYFIGIMFILRKIILWFLLIVSPFLVLMAPFVTIRNIAWIWIGVFFQWLFYGPLFALFLGALANIWNGVKTIGSATNIPYIFDFSRRHYVSEIVYPTAINILYGGPAQKLGVYNSSNYVDTFAEYVISLLMLWTAILFPWWLLRIFRDYCCDGIYAMKNILLSYYQDWRAGGGNPSTPQGPLNTGFTGLAKEISNTLTQDIKRNTTTQNTIQNTNKIETISQIKQATSQEIASNITMRATKLTDIARFETNKEAVSASQRNLSQIANPMTATSSTDRTRLANMRNEITDRAAKGDRVARATLASFSTQGGVRVEEKQRILSTISTSTPAIESVAQKTGSTVQKTSNVVKTMYKSVSENNQIVNNIASDTSVTSQDVQTVLASMTSNLTQAQPASGVINSIARETKLAPAMVKKVMMSAQTQLAIGMDASSSITNSLTNESRQSLNKVRAVVEAAAKKGNINAPSKEMTNEIATNVGLDEPKVATIISMTVARIASRDNLIKEVAIKEQIAPEVVSKIVDAHLPTVNAPEKSIETEIKIPATVTIEEYEDVKSMWIEQYEKGEIPVSENITTREVWVETDTVNIANILNKLVSTDAKLRSDALDEVGYILPIFMVNGMRGDELAVYLKAKLEAAKQVKKDLVKEQELKEKLTTQEDDTLLEIARPKEVAKPKEMTLTLEQEIPEENKN